MSVRPAVRPLALVLASAVALVLALGAGGPAPAQASQTLNWNVIAVDFDRGWWNASYNSPSSTRVVDRALAVCRNGGGTACKPVLRWHSTACASVFAQWSDGRVQHTWARTGYTRTKARAAARAAAPSGSREITTTCRP